MENLTKHAVICSLLTALVFSSCPITMSQSDSENEFTYDMKGKTGPDKWGDLKPDWNLCKMGSMQSPIDFSNDKIEKVTNLEELQTNYRPSRASIKNRGYDIKVEWHGDKSSVKINGTKYRLVQSHWHSPSEHAIDGTRLDLELHMVHQTPSGQIAVVGIMYRAGRADPFLSSLTEVLEALSDKTGAEKEVAELDPNLVMERASAAFYYRYIGSLTSPPCSENVVWTVFREVRSVSQEQIKMLKEAVEDHAISNARPLQKLNNRVVQFNDPEVKD
ncbi:alpha carbonic anhydrase 7-like [Vigna unguiculata]|uniref:Carbonic anhydrase n=1 Tax=Vigna unguiculata TaxID=3917 RepID=A0A4D6LI27_VIGUN|nr:alpha carbonic anhydrase 7-like [Vigna unguiculata]QCD88168.1 carbonic anhydrase [Vigna unguiculata]